MKKFIAVISTFSALSFAVALAQTSSSSNSGSDTSFMGSSNDMSKSESQAQSGDVSSAKTCTDENGVTYYKGRSGFAKCQQARMESQQKEEMGGVLAEPSPSLSDSSGMSGSMDSNSSGSSVNHRL